VPFTFLRRLFGADVHAIGYQFGLAFFEAPFYAAGRLLESAGVDTLHTHPAAEAMIAFGAAFYVAAALGVVYALLRALGLRWAALGASLALFGSPLFYYGTFSPGQTHAVDAFLASLAAWLIYLGVRRDWPPSLAIVVGVVLGLAPTVRWLEGALGFAVVAMLAVRGRWRAAITISVAAVVTLGLLLLVPPAIGVHVFGGGGDPGRVLSFSPLSPLRMLASPRRGLVLWTPLTLLALAGYVRLVRRRPDLREYLLLMGAMSVALVIAQTAVPFWDAGWSFSQRYLTALFPAVAIGTAGLLEWRPRLVGAVALAAVVWSLFLCLTMQTVGFDERRDTVVDLARRGGTESAGSYAYGVWHISHFKLLVPFNPFPGRPR
jgi:hypothetical protein